MKIMKRFQYISDVSNIYTVCITQFRNKHISSDQIKKFYQGAFLVAPSDAFECDGVGI